MLAALLTPPGRGALAVIHVCGAGAGALVRSLFGREIGGPPRPGILRSGGEALDEVMVRRADGFTGEETVEISCHGGPATVERIFAALGVPRAEPAELLERGVQTGHLDRVRAEAWRLLPRALTGRAARVLRDQAEGALSRAVRGLRSAADASRLLGTAALGLALASPRRLVLAGLPNAGKSTLFNALVAADRAIVSPEPGTTRDPVRERIAVDGIPFELVDTAGVEEARDRLERAAIERARKALGEADLVLFLFDSEAGSRPEEEALYRSLKSPRVIALAGKADTVPARPAAGRLAVSGRTGQGLDELRRRVIEDLGLGAAPAPGSPLPFTLRQERLLAQIAAGGPVEELRRAILSGPPE